MEDYDFGNTDSANTMVEDEPIQPSPAQPFQVKNYGGKVDWNKVNQAVGSVLRIRDFQARQELAKRKAEQEAIRFQGMMEYQQLVDGGATPREALLRTGSKIWHQNPAGFGSAVRHMNPISPDAPKLEDIDGFKFFNFGNRYQLAPGQTANPKKEATDKTAEFLNKSEYSSALKAFENAKKGTKQNGTNKVDEAAVADTARRLRIAEQNLRAPSETKPVAKEAKKITKEIASEILKQAGGDKAKARQLARDAGYTF